jgi:hypothetical protein
MRAFAASCLLFAVAFGAGPGKDRIIGKLTPGQEGRAPILTLDSGEKVELTGDKESLEVLGDSRLKDMKLEAVGKLQEPGRFLVDPIHTKAMRVHRHGKELLISYWCEVCSIRTYTPGVCMCCQDETALDLKERIDP